jgi:hypothetical protein
MQVCQEITAFSRACERLLSKEGMLTDDERGLLEYYMTELSREFFSDKPTVRVRYRESIAPSASQETM